MKKDLAITQGKTFTYPIRWETTPIIYKPITGISQAAPCQITAPSHNMPDGWRLAVLSVKGMIDINDENFPDKDSGMHIADVVDGDTLELNLINSSEFKPYVSGGYIAYYTPHDLTGYVARMTIKDKIGGTELLSLTTENGRIVIDTVAHSVTLLITAADTAAITWSKGVYDLELVSPSGEVTSLLDGRVTATFEVTT